MLYGIISAAKLVNKWALSQIIILKFTNIPIICLVIKTIIRKFAPSLSQENYMKTIIHGPSISKVTFIDPNRARIQLETGETESLITNILNKKFTLKDFQEIYNSRWKIEESFNSVKNKLKIY